VNFTREPIIETVVTPREGCKLVVRSSKGNGQEDYLVDAVEVVSFGHSLFFRSLEKPKSFLVPVSDYEVLELRETRMVLKHVPTERSVKIGGGKEQAPRQVREPHSEPRQQEKELAPVSSDSEVLEPQAVPVGEANPVDPKIADRKRERRRRGRRGRSERAPEGTTPATTNEEGETSENSAQDENQDASDDIVIENKPELAQDGSVESKPVKAPSLLSRLFLAPPPPLIRRHIQLPKPPELPKDPDQIHDATALHTEETKLEATKPKDSELSPVSEEILFTEPLKDDSTSEE
jgi:hypothetical protein